MNRKSRTIATVLLVAMLLSIFVPATTLATSIDYVETPPTTEDVFNGSFSPKEVVAVPGETFDVTFSLCSTMDLPSTVISFVLPADFVELVSGNQVSTVDLKKDETLMLQLSFVANEEVDVNVKAEVEASPDGKNYQSSYYLHVAASDTGSVAMEGAFAKFVTVNLEYASTASNPESSRTVENPQASPQTPGTFEVKGRFWYLNEDGGWSVARYMLARVRDADDSGFSTTQYTDANGYFDFVIANPLPWHRSPILDLIAEGAWDWKSTTDGGGQYWWSTGVLAYDVPDGWVYENNNIGASANAEALQAGDAVYLEMQWIYNRVSWYRPKVTVRWPSGDWPHSHGDYIDLCEKSTYAWDHVTVQHEDGHCVMYNLYGSSWPEGSLGGSHWIGMEDVMPDAWVEGWAEFMQCAVDNDPTNLQGNGQNIETNTWNTWQDSYYLDGQYIEGCVASILWDINDPVNIAGDKDHMYWGYNEIFTVLRYGDAGSDDNPNTIFQFWDDWESRWDDTSTSLGPLCTIFWNYGVDEDYLPYGKPWGSISVNAGATYTTSRTVTLTLVGEDWGSGVRYMRFSENMGSWSSWVTYATSYSYTLTTANDGYKTVDVQFGDYWLQTSTQWGIWDGIYLDTTAPTGSITINSGAAYTTSRTVTLTISASDNYGVAQMRFSENIGAWGSWKTYATSYSYTLTTANDGGKYIDIQFKDNAGNISPAWAIWDYIYLDTTAPTASITVGSGNPAYTTTTSVTLYLTYSDAGSGVYQVRYGNAGGTWSAWQAPAATKAWTLISGDGSKSVWYQVKDNAGNICAQVGDYITLDTTAPTGSIIINGGAATTTTTSVTLSLTYSDATSGVKEVRYGNAGGTWSAWEAPAATKAWTLSSGDGVKTVYYQIKDNAGLLSSYYTDSITLQTAGAAYLVVRGGDNKVYYRAYSGGVWGSWHSIAAATGDSLGAAMLGNNLHIIARNLAGTAIYHGYVNVGTNAFSGWTLISGSPVSAPTLTSNGAVLSLVVRGPSNKVWYRTYSGGVWGSWHSIASATGDSLGATMLGDNLHIIARNLAGTTIYHGYVNVGTNAFSGWTLISGHPVSKPTLTS